MLISLVFILFVNLLFPIERLASDRNLIGQEIVQSHFGRFNSQFAFKLLRESQKYDLRRILKTFLAICFFNLDEV